MNRLLFGDNLKWLRDPKVFADGSVDLVYLDPPFNSNANYNVLFKEASGAASEAQFHAFTDTWEWTAEVDATYAEFIDTCANVAVVELAEALKKFLKTSPMMAYLAMMAPRLVELHRVLKPTGSLYLHCDPTASHYLRMVLDGIFGARNFRNEIIWKKTNSPKPQSRYFGEQHDVIFFYTRSDAAPFEKIYAPLTEKQAGVFSHADERGRFQTVNIIAAGLQKYEGRKEYEFRGVKKAWLYSKEKMAELWEQGLLHPTPGGAYRKKIYLEDTAGSLVSDLWVNGDVKPMQGGSAESLGYPTQKPVALMERIITASCPKDGVVLDPFCGCGTTVHAAQKLGRAWVGIDVTYLAINLIKQRLRDAFPKGLKFEEKGQPEDAAGARRLAELDKFQFQHWALSLVGARPLREGGGKGADRGVDGLLYFYESKDERAKLIVQVKGGGVKRSDIATLLGDVANQQAAGGVLLTLEPPTKAMNKEVVDAGRYRAKLWPTEFPKLQILTIAGLLDGSERLNAPPSASAFARAEVEGTAEKQTELL
ncbi:MAG: hypothetical protein RLZZ15_1075 [Verrucomicrobiota bacterium]